METRPIEIDPETGAIIVVDKPLRWTSTDIVRKIKFRLEKRGWRKIKIGHAGTLDPLATGVLVICVGKATKRVEELQAQRKEYVAELELGATTPSFDREKEIDRRYPTEHITEELLRKALDSLTGDILQTPPIFSAKKIEGMHAYDYARMGEEVELRKVPVSIYSIAIEEFRLPYLRIRVECSKGTYIRALARDIGEALGSGAYLTSLRRTRSGEKSVEDAWQIDELLENLPTRETKSE